MYFHGSKYRFDQFRAPIDSGIIRPSEEKRRVNLDVVFLSTNPELAMQYAGNGGYVYEVEANTVKSLRATREDSALCRNPKTVDPSIYVAAPLDVEIIAVWQVIKHKRHNTALVEAD